MSHFSPSEAGAHHGTGLGPHAEFLGASPKTRYDQTGAPVSSLNATIDFQNAPGCSHASLKKPFGAAALQATTLAGSVYGCPNVPNTSPSAASTAGAENIVAPA